MTSNKISKIETGINELLLIKYEKRLKEIRSFSLSEIQFEEIEELCRCLELEFDTLDSEESCTVSWEKSASLKDRYLEHISQFRESVKTYKHLTEESYSLNETNMYFLEENRIKFTDKLMQVIKYFEIFEIEELSAAYVNRYFSQQFNRLIQRVTFQFINQVLPVEYRDSIDIIDKTLAQPELFSLPDLVSWRKIAEEKINTILNHLIPKLPQTIEKEIIKKYESLIKQLRAKILKLRTYPIPEPWCSHAMRVELTHLIKGEFIFFVHPGIEEDMRPLRLSDRDILPGGLTRQDYNLRMNRMKRESTTAIEELKAKSASYMEENLKWFIDSFAKIERDVNIAVIELPLLYRDGRSLVYLVDKNQDDELLQETYKTLLRLIRHSYNNRINIPSVVIDYNNDPMLVSPPKAERNIPIASGVDRDTTVRLQLKTPSSVIVIGNNVITADKYAHLVTMYRAWDLAPYEGSIEADTPVSLTIFKEFLYVCCSSNLMQCRLTWRDDSEISNINHETTIPIERCCCTASNNNNVFVGTLTPSIMLINTDTLKVDHEIPLNPLCYQQKNRYPWLQDMKAGANFFFCLFTGSPFPLQMFSLEGELIRTILTENQIMVAYNFNVYFHPIKMELMFYICDFWDNDIKVFDYNGKFIESFCEKGSELCQLIHPTAIFIEHSGYITICDMKDDNCVQRL